MAEGSEDGEGKKEGAAAAAAGSGTEEDKVGAGTRIPDDFRNTLTDERSGPFGRSRGPKDEGVVTSKANMVYWPWIAPRRGRRPS